MDGNPLLEDVSVPRFADVRAEHAEPAVRQAIDDAERAAAALLADDGEPTWDRLVEPLYAADERVEHAAGTVAHLAHVLDDPAMLAANRAVQPLVAGHWTHRMQDETLHRALGKIRARTTFLSPARRKVLDDCLRDMRLAGTALPDAQRDRCREIEVELADLGARFAENVVHETDAFRLVLDREEDVAGLPESVVAAARAQALADDRASPPGRHSFTLHAPSMTPFLTHQRDRALRERMYRANVNRATSGGRDNAPLMQRILALRAEKAHLLGFANFAELSLAKKMAGAASEVREFVEDVVRRARPKALAECEEMAAFARRDGVTRLERHDLLHYRERMRRERFDFSDEELRRYFPLPRVIEGLVEVVRRLYGVEVEVKDPEQEGSFPAWHPDVRVFAFREPGRAPFGHVFADFFARPGKQPGAWVSGSVPRWSRPDGTVRTPVAYLVCNFTPPADGGPTLLRYDELRTLFHEFGHALHNVLTRVDEPQAAGVNGVPWDAVELPSQFFENWIEAGESLLMVSCHAATGEPIPDALLERVLASRTFLRAIDVVRQMELALADLDLHTTYDPAGRRPLHDVVREARERIGVLPVPEWDRFENGFNHLFAGPYAAGYYGYAWAEVLAADAFSRFEEEGLFSQRAASDFRDNVLARGGSADFLDLYVAFRGRPPNSEAFVRRLGV